MEAICGVMAVSGLLVRAKRSCAWRSGGLMEIPLGLIRDCDW
jgi:hypothetical protein